MLYGLEWLDPETTFPPETEKLRLEAYRWYTALFDLNPYWEFGNYANRLIANFDEFFDLPFLLGFQRLSTIKLADMVMGSPPSITVNGNDKLTDLISKIRDQTNFDEKMYSAVIDFSRYGSTIFRIFNDDEVPEDRANFAVWNTAEWFPVLKKDGTKRIAEHVLVWRANYGTCTNPDWYLEVQRHPVKGGKYILEKYRMNGSGDCVQEKLKSKTIKTDGLPCLVQHVSNLASTTNIYGTSDYKIINELVFRATERIEQILHILDKHADPSMTGPVSMLERDENTGELCFKASRFYAVSPGEEHPEYMTWDGQLTAAFQSLEMLLNLIYTMSEMGEAIMGNSKGSGQAISGTAMRYKMISPLEKARRVANSFTLPIKKLMSALILIETGQTVDYQDITVTWEDSLPKDPRETAELSRLQSGAPQIIPLKHVLMENYDMSAEAADHYIEEIQKDREMWNKEDQPAVDPYVGKPERSPNVLEKGSPNEPSKTGTNSSPDKKEDTK